MLADAPPLPPPQPNAVLAREFQRNGLLPGVHTPPNPQCFLQEAARNDVDPYVLLAVLKTENGRPGEVALNRNGTADLGPMSVNTVWLPVLAKRYGMTEPEVRRRVASDGCANVAAAAWILGRKIAETGSVWEGVARFHSRNPAKQATYLRRVHDRLAGILARLSSRRADLQ